MMPQLVTVKVDRPSGRPFRLWVPVLPVLIVASPIIFVAAVCTAAACVMFRVSVLRGFGAGWRIMSALPGTRFGLEQGRTAVLVTIR